MSLKFKAKAYPAQQIFDKWMKTAWQSTPSEIITMPMNGYVLFGAVSQGEAERVSFALNAEDARDVGRKFIKAAKASTR